MGEPTFRYHPEHGADIFDSDLLLLLEKQGWKDTPKGMNLKPYDRVDCYSAKIRRGGRTVKEILAAEPAYLPEAIALLNKGELNMSSWMRAQALNPQNPSLRKKAKEGYEVILKHLEGKIVKDKTSWGWK